MRVWVACLVVMGCGGTNVEPDAPPPIDAPPFVPGPNTVTLTVLGQSPLYIRYRDGMGSWTVPSLVDNLTYELHITDDYQVAAVCGDESVNTFDTELLYQTFADGADATVYCFGALAAAPPVTATIRGQMQQAGDVFFFDRATSLTEPWTFVMNIPLGTYDLFAVGQTAMAARRGEVVDMGRTLATIDLAQEGHLLDIQPFNVNAAPDETVESSALLYSPNGFAIIAGSPTQLRIPPATVIQPADQVVVSIVARSESHERIVESPPSPSYSLLPKLDILFSFATSDLYASWTALPGTYDTLTMNLYGSQHGTVTASKRWVDVSGVTRLSLAARPPDYDVRWAPVLGGGYYSEVSAITSFDGLYRSTSVIKQMAF